MNNVSIIGRLTATPELKTTPSGKSVTSFTLAVKRPRSKDETDFITCVAWNQTAEFICKYFVKGQAIGITGSIQSRTYTKDDNKRTVIEVTVTQADFAGNKPDSSSAGASSGESTYDSTYDDYLPFG